MAEPLLYRHIVIKDIRLPLLSLLKRTLSTKRRPNGAPAGAWTRKITVIELPLNGSKRIARIRRGLRDVILLCPNLEFFCIGGWLESPYCCPEVTEDILEALPDHLRVCAWANHRENVHMRLFRDSCSFFSMLEHLRLRNISGYRDEQVILTFPRLRSLSFASWISGYHIDQWDLPSLVWLEISVENAVWLEKLGSFFSKHGKKLEFLQLVPGLFPISYIEIPLNFFQYFPLLSCFSLDPSWMQLRTIEESEKIPAVPYKNLTTLHILRRDPRHGSHNSCSEFVRSFFVAHQNLFPRLKVISITIKGEYVVVPVFYPWFCSGVRPTREELAKLGDEFCFDLIDHAYS